MTERLIIWLPVETEGPWTWVIDETHGQVDADTGYDALRELRAREIIAVLPGQWARMFSHNLPKMRESERVTAAGFSIEDKLAGLLKTQHIALGSKDDDRIAVISAGKMQAVLNALSMADINPDGVYVDFDVLSSSFDPLRLPDRIVVPGPQGHSLDAAWDDGEFADLAITEFYDVSGRVQTDGAINLRQGKFSRKSAFKLGNVGWGRAAALLAVLGVSWAALQGVEARAVNQQAEAMKAEASRLYTESTGKKAPANPALAVTRAIKTNPATGADYLTLSHKLFAALAETDGIIIDTIQFDQNSQRLNLRLIYPQFESAGELERVAQDMGGTFQPGGVREQGGELVGDAVFTLEEDS